jgi:hypothetical protein
MARERLFDRLHRLDRRPRDHRVAHRHRPDGPEGDGFTRFNSTADWTQAPPVPGRRLPAGDPMSRTTPTIIKPHLGSGETLEGFGRGFFRPPRPQDWKYGPKLLIAVTSNRILLFGNEEADRAALLLHPVRRSPLCESTEGWLGGLDRHHPHRARVRHGVPDGLQEPAVQRTGHVSGAATRGLLQAARAAQRRDGERR